MKTIFKSKTYVYALATFLVVAMAQQVHAHNTNGQAHVAIGGYDPVAYFEVSRPTTGNGYHTATYNGATYLFSSKKNQERFETNPAKYAPQFGGYCAYGVSVGKKFFSDPQRWKIVDGKLYLNLGKAIQKKFNADVAGALAKAEVHWERIKDKAPSEL